MNTISLNNLGDNLNDIEGQPDNTPIDFGLQKAFDVTPNVTYRGSYYRTLVCALLGTHNNVMRTGEREREIQG